MSEPECPYFDELHGPIPRIFSSLIHSDHRGHFSEVINRQEVPVPESVAQINFSHSTEGVIRGMHWQRRPYDVSKFVTCLNGLIEDVVVDLRKGSVTFGKYQSYVMSGIAATGDRLSLWVPEGFAHGFLTLSKTADVMYLQSGVYHPEAECSLSGCDPAVGISWVSDVAFPFILSDKDKNAPLLSELSDADLFL